MAAPHAQRLAPRHTMLIVAVGMAFAVLLGVLLAGGRRPHGADAAFAHAVTDLFDGQQPLLRLLATPTEPWILVAVVTTAALGCGLQRRWSAVVLVTVGPSVAIAVNTWLLKPLFDRHYGQHLAYPSGHAVALVAVLTAVLLLARPGTARCIVAVLSGLLVVAAAVGLVGLRYHYLTDVVGALGYAIATVLALDVVIDRHRNRVSVGPVP